MSSKIQKINCILLEMNNIICGKEKSLENVVEEFNQEELTSPMYRFSQLGGKIASGGMINSGKYGKLKDLVEGCK